MPVPVICLSVVDFCDSISYNMRLINFVSCKLYLEVVVCLKKR